MIEGALRRGPGFGHPDLMEIVLRPRLDGLGQLVQDVAALVHPAALFARLSVDLAEGGSEAERSITNRKLR